MISRGDKITVFHSFITGGPVRGVVTLVHERRSHHGDQHFFDWDRVEPAPVAMATSRPWTPLLSTHSEGWVWVRGHGDEQDQALLAAKALS